ncbi:M48 family peptidase [Candidatus Magnetoovum chiemensis]|nr:M48 family peptidase [Candidatus Magnetoovum chiemensis]
MDRHVMYKQRRLNFIIMLALFAALAAMTALIGWIIGGMEGVQLAGIVVLIFFIFYPRLSPSIVLNFIGARQMSLQNEPHLHNIIVTLAKKANLTVVPKIYYLSKDSADAFTIGNKKNPVIIISRGLLNLLDRRELIGVLAHEISHIQNGDLVFMRIADAINRVTSALSLFGQIALFLSLPMIWFSDYSISLLPFLVLIVAPTISQLIEFALSRTREFNADISAASLTGDPEGLARALNKIDVGRHGLFVKMLLFPSKADSSSSLFKTHPLTKYRVERLMRLIENDYKDSPSKIYSECKLPEKNIHCAADGIVS